MKKVSILLRITAFCLAVMMLFSMTACGINKPNEESTPTVTGSDVVNSDEQNNESEVESTDSSSPESSSVENSSSQKPTSSTSGTSSTTVKKSKKFAADPYSDIPADVKKKTVKVLLWQAPSKQEKERIADFTKKTGIKVDVKHVSQNLYNDTLISRISSGDSPDVAYLNETSFPSNTIKLFSALDPTIYKLEDSIWDKALMNQFKVGGNYYGVNIKGNFAEDTAMVLFYNKTLLDNNNIEDPYKSWKKGNWNWSTFETILAKVKACASLSKYRPLYFYQPSALIGSAGVNFISYNGKKFSDNINNTTLVDAYQKLATWREKGYVSAAGFAGTDAAAGNFVFYSCIAYHLKAQDTFFGSTGKTSNGEIRAVPFPSPKGSKVYVAENIKMFGTAKGAKNKEGAAYFLRYYLDPANQDMKNAFANPQAKEVWDYIHKQNKVVDYAQSVISYVNTSAYLTLQNTLMSADSTQIRKVISEQSNVVTKAVSTVNSKVLKN